MINYIQFNKSNLLINIIIFLNLCVQLLFELQQISNTQKLNPIHNWGIYLVCGGVIHYWRLYDFL